MQVPREVRGVVSTVSTCRWLAAALSMAYTRTFVAKAAPFYGERDTPRLLVAHEITLPWLEGDQCVPRIDELWYVICPLCHVVDVER